MRYGATAGRADGRLAEPSYHLKSLTYRLDLIQPECHELAESFCGPGLLHHATDNWTHVRLSRRTKTSRVSRRRTRRRRRLDVAGSNNRTCRRVHDRVGFSDTAGGLYLSR